LWGAAQWCALLTGACFTAHCPAEPVLAGEGDYRRGRLSSEDYTTRIASPPNPYPGLSFQLRSANNVLGTGILSGPVTDMEICNPAHETPQTTCACEAQGLPCGATYARFVGGSPGSFCVAGQCCANDCGGPSCVNYQVDPANCGGCGNACSASQTCVAGVCT